MWWPSVVLGVIEVMLLCISFASVIFHGRPKQVFVEIYHTLGAWIERFLTCSVTFSLCERYKTFQRIEVDTIIWMTLLMSQIQIFVSFLLVRRHSDRTPNAAYFLYIWLQCLLKSLDSILLLLMNKFFDLTGHIILRGKEVGLSYSYSSQGMQ